ncbi:MULTISPECIES: GFA family protein [Hyphobacterium]|uniref:GFA family protein n=1 Tax=Hyphobacterium vulgare TaxID=1736751 RepID=A0ABV6ZU27_9PROT
MAYEGGCGCGAVRYRAVGDPKFVANCHCASCRHHTGAAFSTWAGFRDDQVEWTGDRSLHESSPGVRRGFCAKCGTPLSYQGEKWPGETHLTLGSLDDPAALTPKGDAFAAEALDWSKPRA